MEQMIPGIPETHLFPSSFHSKAPSQQYNFRAKSRHEKNLGEMARLPTCPVMPQLQGCPLFASEDD